MPINEANEKLGYKAYVISTIVDRPHFHVLFFWL